MTFPYSINQVYEFTQITRAREFYKIFSSNNFCEDLLQNINLFHILIFISTYFTTILNSTLIQIYKDNKNWDHK